MTMRAVLDSEAVEDCHVALVDDDHRVGGGPEIERGGRAESQTPGASSC
jgi:hypothetical protein